MENSINIRDLIIDSIASLPTEPKKTKSEPESPQYRIVLENDSDFAIRRTTKRLSRLLVCIASQGQIYIKNERDNSIDTKITADKLNRFLLNFRDSYYKSNPFTKLRYPLLDSSLSISPVLAYMCEKPKVIKDLVNSKIFSFDSDIIHAAETNFEVFKFSWFYTLDTSISWQSLFDTYEGLASLGITKEKLQFNRAKIVEISNRGNHFFKNDLHSALSVSACEFNSFVDYILYTIVSNNGLTIERPGVGRFTYSDYRDYIYMQKEMFGSIKDKYPENFLSDKQRLTRKYSIWKNVQRMANAAAVFESFKEYEYSDGIFTIVAPKDSNDLIDEGYQLKHCVGTYVDFVVNGKSIIVFLRKADSVDESLVTIEIRNNEITQCKGEGNRPVTEKERKFIYKWAENKLLIYQGQ